MAKVKEESDQHENPPPPPAATPTSRQGSDADSSQEHGDRQRSRSPTRTIKKIGGGIAKGVKGTVDTVIHAPKNIIKVRERDGGYNVVTIRGFMAAVTKCKI